jgi:membrane protease YdiL (CAAX protease family)
MQTAIGRRLHSSPGRLAIAAAIAVLVVAADLALVLWQRYLESIEGRSVLGLAAFATLLWLVEGDLPSVGLAAPRQGWWYWTRAALWIGLAVGACILVGLGAWVLSGRELPRYTVAPGDIPVAFLRMCVFAPMFEETIYRLAVCVPLSVCPGPWKSIAVSGLAFAGLHLLAGNPSPENLVGGFFLAWAYLKSESILVPVGLHGLGNLCALAGQVAAWSWWRNGA